jgi:hypothetical protein
MPGYKIPAIEAHSPSYLISKAALDTEIRHHIYECGDPVKESSAAKQGPQIFIPVTKIQEFAGTVIDREDTIFTVVAGETAKDGYCTVTGLHHQVFCFPVFVSVTIYRLFPSGLTTILNPVWEKGSTVSLWSLLT